MSPVPVPLDRPVTKLNDCVGEAESCVAVLGCATGASMEAAGEFMKGFMRGLQHK